MKMLRSVVAVALGYLVFSVSAIVLFQFSSRDPHQASTAGFIAFSTAFSAFAGILAGYLAAALAGRRPMLHAAIVGGIIEVFALIGAIAGPGTSSRWTQFATILLFAPLALFGGLMWTRRKPVIP